MLPQQQIDRAPADRPDFYSPFLPPDTIAKNILELLHLRGMTQKVFAEKCGVSPAQVTKWLSQCDDQFSIATIKKMAYALAMEPHKMLYPMHDDDWEITDWEVAYQKRHRRPLWNDGVSKEEFTRIHEARMARHQVIRKIVYCEDEEAFTIARMLGFTKFDDPDIRWGLLDSLRVRMAELWKRKRWAWHADEKACGVGEPPWGEGKNQPRTTPPDFEEETSLPGYLPSEIFDPKEANHYRPLQPAVKKKMWRLLMERRARSGKTDSTAEYPTETQPRADAS